MTDFATTTEIVRRARAMLAPPVWDHVIGGAETETTIRRNRQAIGAWAFRPRVLRDVSAIDVTSTLLGTPLRIPYLLAPVGGLEQIVAAGAAAAVRAARRFGTLPVVSSVSQPALEEAAAASDGDKWFQLYIRGDFAWIAKMVHRVRESGYRALVLTVDSAYYGNRERQKLRRWLPAGRSDADVGFQAALDWATVARIQEMAGVPIVLKGIQTGEDADLALRRGIDVIWVSNHGGRQLDHGRGTLEMLPEIAGVVRGKKPVVVDGGFMRGTDVLKAIALGADVVAGGRLYVLALAADGEDGATRLLELLEMEISNAMGLLGVTSLANLDRSYVERHTGTVGDAHPFPLLGDIFSAMV